MTVNEAVAEASRAIGDAVSREEMIRWLCEIENTVVTEIGKTHVGEIENRGTIDDGDGSTILFAPDPHSRLYVHYLLMKSDLAFRDIPQYVNSAAVFAESYKSFADWYNRTYMPLGERIVL